MFISNNHALLHFWCKENLVKHQKVSKYYENDYSYKSLYVDVDCNGKISFQLLTNVIKNSILNVAWILDLVFLELSKILESGCEGVHFFRKIDGFRATALLKRDYFSDNFSRNRVEFQFIFVYMFKI